MVHKLPEIFFAHQQITPDDTVAFSRSVLCLTRMTRITRITHRYTRVVGKPSVDIPEASTSAARARFVSIRAHLWENILIIWIFYVFLLFPTDLHGFSQITHHSVRVCIRKRTLGLADSTSGARAKIREIRDKSHASERDVSFLQIAQRAQPRFNKVNLRENLVDKIKKQCHHV